MIGGDRVEVTTVVAAGPGFVAEGAGTRVTIEHRG